MIRFPNPGSDIPTFIRIFQIVYSNLKNQAGFSLDDITNVLIKMNLASSSGYTGEAALELSTRDDRSRDPLYNQSKMYAELFRSLGFLGSHEDKKLLFLFTHLGAHIASAKLDPKTLFEECILGISYPNDVISNKNVDNMRPFASILNTMSLLNNTLCRDEMIIGPLNVDDRNEAAYTTMISKLSNLRGNISKLNQEMVSLSSTVKIQINTLGNYTRFPIAVLEYCGWMNKVRDNSVYPGSRNMKIFKMTQYGQQKAEWIRKAVDLRYSDILKFNKATQNSIIRVSFYKMLERAGFNIEPILQDIKDDIILCENTFGKDKDLLFSPYQTLNIGRVNQALGINPEEELDIPNKSSIVISNARKVVTTSAGNGKIVLTHFEGKVSIQTSNEDIVSEICGLSEKFNNNSDKITSFLFTKYQKANKDVFYPLVAELFRIIGFNCQVSRAGINYERWDAIIDDPLHSIPIEIKSPNEEECVSVKAVRQALENKIILLSRETYKTDRETSSLVVGYKLPNDRAEVAKLIDDIYTTFDIRIGVIDIHSLLKISVKEVIEAKSFDKSQLRLLGGLINVEDT